MIYIGIDPDTKNTGIAVWSDDNGISGPSLDLLVASAKGPTAQERVLEMGQSLREVLGPFSLGSSCVQNRPGGVIVAIEWQSIRPGDPRPNDILNLAIVAGMALSVIQDIYPFSKILTPLPVQWKGSIAKMVHQARILSKLEPASRALLGAMPKGHQSHVTDAIGLAQWARKTTEEQSRRDSILRQARAG